MPGQHSQLTLSWSIRNTDIPSRIIFPYRFVTLDIRNAIIGLDSDFRAKHFVLDHSKVNVMLFLDLPFFTNKVFEQSTQFICCMHFCFFEAKTFLEFV